MKKIKILSIIAIIMAIGFTMTACPDDKDTIFDIHANGHNFTGSSECLYCGFMYEVGDTGPGGGIVYVADDEGFDFKLANGRIVKRFYKEVSSEDIGEYNWNAASDACKNYNGGGKTDWFLPSPDEMTELYGSIDEADIENLSAEKYWTSEKSIEVGTSFNFSDGTIKNDQSLNDSLNIRATRVF